MKATATQYARVLYEATKDKSHQEIDGVLANFVQTLSKNNQIKLAGNIEKKFGEIYNRENRIVEAEVTSIEKLGEAIEHKIKSFIKNKYKAKKVTIKNIVNKNIKGGVIVKVGDEVLDGSVERQLRNLEIYLER